MLRNWNEKRRFIMKKKDAIIIMTYRAVLGYEHGIHGNGQIFVFRTDAEKLTGSLYGDTLMIYFNDKFRKFLKKNRVTRAYIYFGRYNAENAKNDPNFQLTSAFFSVAEKQVKQLSQIFFVGCSCGIEEKRRICEHLGVTFIESDCSGTNKLGSIIDEYLCK
jgi:hypothetical protein